MDKRKASHFLLKPPALWPDDIFQMSESIKLLKIVNYTPEWSISLIQS